MSNKENNNSNEIYCNTSFVRINRVSINEVIKFYFSHKKSYKNRSEVLSVMGIYNICIFII